MVTILFSPVTASQACGLAKTHLAEYRKKPLKSFCIFVLSATQTKALQVKPHKCICILCIQFYSQPINTSFRLKHDFQNYFKKPSRVSLQEKNVLFCTAES